MSKRIDRTDINGYIEVTIRSFPISQPCMTCKHGIFIQGVHFVDSDYVCLVNSKDNDGVKCKDKEVQL